MSVEIMSLVFKAKIEDIKVEDKTVTAPLLKLVLLALADHANDEGESAYPSLNTLERKTALAHQSVINTLKALKQSGLILRAGQSRRGTTNYSLNVPMLKSLVHLVDYPTTSSQPGLLPLVHLVDSPSLPGVPEPSFNRPLNIIEKYPEKKFFWNDHDLGQVWQDVCDQLRPEIPMGARAHLDSCIPVAWDPESATLTVQSEDSDWLNSRFAKTAENMMIGVLNLADPHIVFTPRSTAV
jgi:hypothetical protein